MSGMIFLPSKTSPQHGSPLTIPWALTRLPLVLVCSGKNTEDFLQYQAFLKGFHACCHTLFMSFHVSKSFKKLKGPFYVIFMQWHTLWSCFPLCLRYIYMHCIVINYFSNDFRAKNGRSSNSSSSTNWSNNVRRAPERARRSA